MKRLKPQEFFLFLILIICLFCVTLKAQGLRVGNEIVIASDGPGKNLRADPAVAYGNGIYLVVWQEGWTGKTGKSRIYAARVSTGGALLDSAGIEIAPCAVGIQECPRVAFCKDRFLVVWHDMRNGKDCDVLAARITPEGEVLDTTPISIAALPRTQALPDVAADTSGFMVVWQGFQAAETACRVMGARVGLDAAVGPVFTNSSLSSRSNPRIVWTGKVFFVMSLTPAGNGWPVVNPARVCLDADGGLIPMPDDRAYGQGGSNFSIASALSGSGDVVMIGDRVYPDFWGWGGPGLIRCNIFSATGVLTPGSDPQYNTTRASSPNWLDFNTVDYFPWGRNAVAWDGTQMVAVWVRWKRVNGTGYSVLLENGDLAAARCLGNTPIPEDYNAPYIAQTPAIECNPVLASNGRRWLLCAYEKQLSTGYTHIAAKLLSSIDTIKPSVAQVSSLDTNQVQVVFSEIVDEITSQTIANYSINKSVVVLSAVLESDKKTVLLTTTRLDDGGQYTLTVSGVSDQAATPNVMNTASFDFACIIIKFLKRYDFRCTATPARSGWISDSGGAYTAQKGYGWESCNTAPDFRCDRAGGPLLGTFIYIPGTTCSTPVFRVDAPDGRYIVRIGLGDASYPNETNWILNGTDTLAKKNPGSGNLGNGYSVCDDTITIADGTGARFLVGGATGAKISYLVLLFDQGIAIGDLADDGFQSVSDEKTVVAARMPDLAVSPNPFNPSVSISVSGWMNGAELKIIDISGKVVADLTSALNGGQRGLGAHSVVWNASGCASGVYVIALKNGKTELRRKALLIR